MLGSSVAWILPGRIIAALRLPSLLAFLAGAFPTLRSVEGLTPDTCFLENHALVSSPLLGDTARSAREC
jgi:hypothetical protein